MKKKVQDNRPWGNWKILKEGENYKIKIITINPHQRLSLQFHKERSEHWIVIEGNGLITIENNEYPAKCNDHFFIPGNTPHRITNCSDTLLKIIEIQYGNCDEDDIIRLEDDYGRV